MDDRILLQFADGNTVKINKRELLHFRYFERGAFAEFPKKEYPRIYTAKTPVPILATDVTKPLFNKMIALCRAHNNFLTYHTSEDAQANADDAFENYENVTMSGWLDLVHASSSLEHIALLSALSKYKMDQVRDSHTGLPRIEKLQEVLCMGGEGDDKMEDEE